VRRLSVCLLVLIGISSPARGQDPALPSEDLEELAKKAVLTLDPGHHIGAIRELLFTPDGQRLISLGGGRPVQVWDVQTHERIKAFSLPAGGAMGAALSPDGVTLLLVRGYRAVEKGQPPASVAYLLNLEDGRILPLTGDKAPVPGVWDAGAAFAADGDRAFVSQRGAFWVWTGLKGVWDRPPEPDGIKAVTHLDTENPAHRGESQRGSIYPTPNGALVAVRPTEGGFQIWDVSHDGKPVRRGLWAVPDRRVGGMAWSPDGKRLAAGIFFARNGPPTAVKIFSPVGADMKTFDVAKKPGDPWDGIIHKLVFRSAHELLLFCQQGDTRFVLSLNLANGSIHEICRTPKHVYWGTVGALAHDGHIGALADGPGRCRVALFEVKEKARLQYLAGPNHDPNHVGWGPNGHTVACNVKAPARLDTALDLQALTLATPAASEKYQQAVLRRPDGWELEMRRGATSNVLIRRQGTFVAATPLTNSSLLSCTLPSRGEVRWVAVATGGGFTMHEAATGKQTGFFRVPMIYAVAPSPDGRYLLGSSAAQTLVVCGPRQPYPLMNVFFAGSEWIVWAGRGYYAASLGGERLMGWNIDNGPNSLASFYPARQFRATLHRPDVISRLLHDGNLQKALENADRERGLAQGEADVEEVLPPKVTVRAPALKGSKVMAATLEVEATARGGGKQPITALQLLMDGRPLPDRKGLRSVRDARPGAEITEKWTVELPEGEHTLRVLARTAASTGFSDDLEVTFAREVPRPRLFLLSVGIDAYADKNLKLNCAVNDAKGLADTFVHKGAPLFDVKPKVLTNKQATRAGIVDGLNWLKQGMEARDVAVIFYAGHGEREDKSFYLLPQDARLRDLKNTGVSGETLKEHLANLPGRVVLLLDACHSGEIGKVINDLGRDLADEDCGVVVVCAALGSEKAQEARGHGYFCQALMEALRGDNGTAASPPPKNLRDGYVYLHHLEQYVIDRVQELSNNEQHPTAAKPALRPLRIAKP
jgi:hypothetical protein